MKEYVRPTFEFVELRPEERLAAACPDAIVSQGHCPRAGQS